MTVGVLNNRKRFSRPSWPWCLNYGSWQTNGLVGFWPLMFPGDETNMVPGNRFALTNVNGATIEGAGGFDLTRRFVLASAQHFNHAAAILTAAPITMACWFNTNDLSVAQELMVCGISGTVNNHRFALLMAGNVANDPLRATTQQTAGSSSTLDGTQAGVWHMGCAVFASAASRIIYRDLSAGAEETTTRTPAGVNNFKIGVAPDATTRPMSGQICHACIWNRALTPPEAAMLYDPSSRWDLYYPIGKRTWFSPPAVAFPRYRKRLATIYKM